MESEAGTPVTTRIRFTFDYRGNCSVSISLSLSFGKHIPLVSDFRISPSNDRLRYVRILLHNFIIFIIPFSFP